MRSATLVKATRYVSLLCCGMLAGVAVTVLFLELALRRLNGPAYVRVRQVEFTFFTWYIGAITVPTLVAVAVLVIYARKAQSPILRPAAIALGLLLLALLVTLAVNGPINVEELGWNVQAPPADWAHDVTAGRSLTRYGPPRSSSHSATSVPRSWTARLPTGVRCARRRSRAPAAQAGDLTRLGG
ncbi:anthrone oxygenase family protein [Streptomyces sp. CA-106131]|uniref:anthrone oxygenase family protein n=1 Tax=Streptomyces sp. CA-106131 TaxID=3240045 RepID=UPI003D9405B4